MVVLPGSPAVVTSENDYTSVIPGISGSAAATVGAFRWGPANVRVQITNENQLRSTFLPPDANTYLSFLSGANFLSYGSDLRVVRALGPLANNATVVGTGIQIQNEYIWDNTYVSGSTTYGEYAARYAGAEGNSLLVSTCPSANAWNKVLTATANTTNGSPTVVFSSNITNLIVQGDMLTIGNTGFVQSNVYITNVAANGLVATVNTNMGATLTGNAVTSSWYWAQYFPGAPGTGAYAASVGGSADEMHVIVVDQGGTFSSPPVGNGGANTVLQIFPYVSKATDARNNDGTGNYVRDVIRNQSPYIYWMGNLSGGTNWGNSAIGTAFTTVATNKYSTLAGGQTDTPGDAALETGWTQFTDKDTVDVSFLIGGSTSSTLANYLISNVAEVYKYAVLFLSPRLSDVVNVPGAELTNISAFAATLPASDRTFIDSNWKYMLDRYNNVFRWVPCNPDTAGLCIGSDPWVSPAGMNRGGIKNATKLAWNPNQAQRDLLYPLGVNPVFNMQGKGPVLFGDKTFVTKPSSFSRIGVRRMFQAIEKQISGASKFSLFEFNDEFTRSQFVNLVTPFLQDVKGRRGITDFKVICDETNNTPQVVQSNQFVGTIMVKPNYSINWVVLNFVAVNNQVSFDTVPLV